jgi:hypothetical protein
VQTLNERAGTAAFFFPGSSDEDKIRVSVHNFTRPLKRHRGELWLLIGSPRPPVNDFVSVRCFGNGQPTSGTLTSGAISQNES